MNRNAGKNDPPKTLSPQEAGEIIRLANIIYFRTKVWDNSYWMGLKLAKCPMDLWIYQELIVNNQPDVLIETGTYTGGSALFFAQIMDLVGHGKVITVDIEKYNTFPKHPRIEYLTGSSTDPSIIGLIKNRIAGSSKTMVILDSDHHTEHKLKEMEVYGSLMYPGDYMIVEDSCFDEYPAWPEFGPGPAAAIREYFSRHADFEIDKSMEKHLISFAPKGFLRKTKP